MKQHNTCHVYRIVSTRLNANVGHLTTFDILVTMNHEVLVVVVDKLASFDFAQSLGSITRVLILQSDYAQISRMHSNHV